MKKERKKVGQNTRNGVVVMIRSEGKKRREGRKEKERESLCLGSQKKEEERERARKTREPESMGTSNNKINKNVQNRTEQKKKRAHCREQGPVAVKEGRADRKGKGEHNNASLLTITPVDSVVRNPCYGLREPKRRPLGTETGKKGGEGRGVCIVGRGGFGWSSGVGDDVFREMFLSVYFLLFSVAFTF